MRMSIKLDKNEDEDKESMKLDKNEDQDTKSGGS